MTLSLPSSLSPSKVASFTDCALAFRYSVIDRLPEPPSAPAVKGTLVHLALQHLLDVEPASERTIETALGCLERARTEMADAPDYTGLGLAGDDEADFHAGAEALVRRYFELEDPTRVRPIGLELRLEAEIGGVTLRGIIDRLELDTEGNLVITDYKTGRSPNERHERGRLGGVQFYAFLCERLFGRRPARIQLLYLADAVAIVAEPSDQSIRGLERKVGAVWQAVERACQRDDFRPNPGPLCAWCAFRDRCPAFATTEPAAPEPDVTVPVALPI